MSHNALLSDVDRVQLLDAGTIFNGAVGGVPDGWTVVAANPALMPVFKLVEKAGGGKALQVSGNGRPECFGWIQYPVMLAAGKTYRFRARFRFQDFQDVNRHLIHAVYGKSFNQGAMDYRREGDSVIAEGRFAGPAHGEEATVRLYFRFSADGRVWWDDISLCETEPVAPRPVTIGVTHGAGDLNHWGKVLDAAGRNGCDIVLLPEMFDGNHDPMKAEPMDGPAMSLLSRKAAEHGMYVSGSLYLQRGDLNYNSAPLFDRRGKCIGMYDKNMLYDPELDKGATSGDAMPVFDTDFGKVAAMICYDSWHPSVAKLLALRGAELILFPSAGYYVELMYARAADNGVVIAASSEGGPLGVWDAGGNRAGEPSPEPSRYAPNSVRSVKNDEALHAQFVTVDLSIHPSPHYWGGPMLSAPGGRRVRTTSPNYLEDDIAREVRRWNAP